MTLYCSHVLDLWPYLKLFRILYLKSFSHTINQSLIKAYKHFYLLSLNFHIYIYRSVCPSLYLYIQTVTETGFYNV